jgi:hypothetical protein
MNCAILGLSRAEIDERFDDIARFADIGDFIAQPVKTYSSGMYVRLAFATAINGVYNGTYTCALGPRTLKLSLLTSGNGSLTGVFTFYLPPTSHTQAFSYSLNGTFDASSGKFRLNPVKWETPPPGGYIMVGMDGAFDPSTGQVVGKITYGNCRNFQATRDQAASANIAGVITSQQIAFIQNLKMVNNMENLISENLYIFEEPELKSVKDAVQEVRVKAFDSDSAFGHTGGGTLNYAGIDNWSYGAVPTDGVHSLLRNGSTAPSPTMT